MICSSSFVFQKIASCKFEDQHATINICWRLKKKQEKDETG